jgi:hypothetical protein
MKNLELTVYIKVDDETVLIDKEKLDDDILGGEIDDEAQRIFEEHCNFEYKVTDSQGKDVTDVVEW